MTSANDSGSIAYPARLPQQGSAAYLAGICLVASLGGLLFGFDTAVISGTVKLVTDQYVLSSFGKGWFTSSALVGCILGAAVAGALGDRFGRKPILIVASVLLFVSALYSAIPPNFDVLTWARIIGGVGVGIASVIAPIYISEFAPPRWRGRLVAIYQLSIVLGILAAYCSNWLLMLFAASHPGALDAQGWLHWTLVAEVWRGMFGMEMIPCVLFFLLLFLVPESPRWLVKAGQDARAMATLARVNGEAAARRELAEIRQAMQEDVASAAELFKPGLRMALIVAVALSVFGQLSGVNIVVYYGPIILQEAGFRSADSLQWQALLGVINLIFTLVALWKVDSWGRRPLLIWGMAVVTFSLGTTAVLMLGKAPPLAIVGLLCLYMGCEALSICAVIWVLTPEMFPNRVRGRAVSIATFANWTTNTVGVYLFPWYVDTFGMAAGFVTVATICLAATLFFWRYVPETKGKSLEEITRVWLS